MGYHSPTFYLLLCFHFISVLCSSPSSPTHLCSPNQSAALFQLPHAWKKGTDCCLWDGVSCDNITDEVISLDLSCSCLSGTFPSNTTTFILSSLQRLDLPSTISGNPKSLQISLHLSYRPSINLIGFQAPGPILTLEKSAINRIVQNLTQVREIDLDGIDILLGCHLRGKFLKNIFKLPNIEYLSLDENPKLTGRFPKSNWSSPLVGLSASETSLSGELPESFGDLKSLTGLAPLFSNFSGSIPRSLGNLTQLEFLVLSYNYFSGKIPSSLANLAKLRILSLGDNQLEGCIPNNPNPFPNLRYLDLSDNLLSGTTPSWLYTIPLLRSLDLRNNQFIGHISEFQSKVLSAIILKDNSFCGPIPSSISKLVNLIVLDLSSNFIEGDLPKLPPNIRLLSVSNNNLTRNFPHICNSKFLEILDLSHNNFSGVIPQCIGSFIKNLSSLNLKMNKFHGTIPSTFAKGCALKNLNLNSNHLEGPLTPSITNCKDLQALSKLQVLVLHSNKFHVPITTLMSSRSLPKL
ncbi:receptor-like protein 12 isoform X1 [Gossypium australe]|uniref:Receptor-like protein 12 isoform X1 n=1 Tax=Gossypium australe TaxID=47621 RepID=A0A5B6VDN2_9ROSI|nr:receptor-like protein 12 isoform X1 [Gossypium australe]